MITENIFEYATKNRLRFPYKGSQSTEDLWSLNVEELDKLFKVLNSKAKLLDEESLLEKKNEDDKILEIQIAIVKHIVAVKLEEKAAREKAVENKAKKQKILEILAAREDKVLENTTDEALRKMLAEMETN